MSLTISCPHCQSKMRAPDDAVGKDVRCPTCQQVFRVDGDAGAVAPAPRRPRPAPAPAPAPAGGGLNELEGVDAPTGRRRTSSPFVDFLLFRRMIAPLVIQILFWVGVVGCVIAAGVQVITGIIAATGPTGSLLAVVIGLFGALVTITVGPFVLRIYAELLILLFRIHEALTEIKDRLERR